MTQLYQRTFGQGENSIVLVHGWGMHSGIWGDFAEQLAQHYQVTCVDLPGHGNSPFLDEFTLASISDALVATVAAEQSCWLGWSLGAAIALEVAARFPERVSSLILLAGNPRFVQTEGDAWPGMALEVFDAFSHHVQQNPITALAQFLSLQVYGLVGGKSQLRHIKEALSQCAAPNNHVLQSALALLKSSDMREPLAQLTCPVLVILGEKDTLVPVALEQALRANYPAIQVQVVTEAGHVLFLSHQNITLALISRFMDVE